MITLEARNGQLLLTVPITVESPVRLGNFTYNTTIHVSIDECNMLLKSIPKTIEEVERQQNQWKQSRIAALKQELQILGGI